MGSTVHFKFKSQKDFTRVAFDGTGISVFELKREIITLSKLGDGSDFELAIYNADTGEEYADDTTLVPRTTRVIARRLPPARPGKGGAARYVSGRMPANAKSVPKADAQGAGQAAGAPASQVINNAQSEEEKIKALLNLQESQWKVQQEEMANATPVAFGRGRGKPLNVPDHPPPPGYLCYRCREKGHWIQACPTNNDPNFDGRYRVKRSTGIPRSLQKTVERPDGVEGTAEEKVSGVMVNADGDFVIAQPDKASWELYQEKAKAAAAAAAEAAAVESSKEIEARGLQCPIDKRLFLEPTKTPCCGKTYCADCITNALIESDFVCPGCQSDGVLLDDLTTNAEVAEKIAKYEEEREEAKRKAKDKGDAARNDEHAADGVSVKSPKSTSATPGPTSAKQSPVKSTATTPTVATSEAASAGKKRAAEDESSQAEKKSEGDGPETKKQKQEGTPQPQQQVQPQGQKPIPQRAAAPTPVMGQPQMGFGPMPFSQPPFGAPFNAMPGFPNQPFPGPPMSMPGFMPGMNMPDGYWNMPNMGNMPFMPPGGFPPAGMPPNQMMGGGFMPGFGNGMGPGPFMNPAATPAAFFGQPPRVNFANQQRNSFGAPFKKEEDNAYLRQPVNPHRQNRQKRL